MRKKNCITFNCYLHLCLDKIEVKLWDIHFYLKIYFVYKWSLLSIIKRYIMDYISTHTVSRINQSLPISISSFIFSTRVYRAQRLVCKVGNNNIISINTWTINTVKHHTISVLGKRAVLIHTQIEWFWRRGKVAVYCFFRSDDRN
jgi:hypothetical protein